MTAKQKRMGRPPKPSGERLTAKIDFLCLPEEREAMERAAEKKAVKLSKWVREIAVRASR